MCYNALQFQACRGWGLGERWQVVNVDGANSRLDKPRVEQTTAEVHGRGGLHLELKVDPSNGPSREQET